MMDPRAAPEFGDRVAPRAPAVNSDSLVIDPHAAPEFGDRVAPAAPAIPNVAPAQQDRGSFQDRKDAAAEEMTSGGGSPNQWVVDEPGSQKGGSR
jgi:hypothetical protein